MTTGWARHRGYTRIQCPRYTREVSPPCCASGTKARLTSSYSALVGTRRRHLFFDRLGRMPTRLWRCQDAGRAPSEFSCEDTSSLAVSDSFVEGDSFVRGGSLEQGGRYVRPIDVYRTALCIRSPAA